MKIKIRDFIICDTVITEAVTGKKSLIGKFDAIHAVRFPCTRTFCVYLSLVEAREEYRMSFEIVNISSGSSIAKANFPHAFQNPDPITPVEVTFQMNVKFPQEGAYDLRIFCNCELVDSRLILLRTPKNIKGRNRPDKQEGESNTMGSTDDDH